MATNYLYSAVPGYISQAAALQRIPSEVDQRLMGLAAGLLILEFVQCRGPQFVSCFVSTYVLPRRIVPWDFAWLYVRKYHVLFAENLQSYTGR